jgi:tetratricopeptide (TPR) repeat protein
LDVWPESRLGRQALARWYREQGWTSAALLMEEKPMPGQSKPQDTKASLEIGMAQFHQGQLQTARETLLTALNFTTADSPSLGTHLNYIGSCYLHLHQPGMAIQFLKVALAAEQHQKFAYTNLGLAYERIQLSGPAEEAFRKAIEVAPDVSWTEQARQGLLRLESKGSIDP